MDPISLKTELRQDLKLSPQLLQSMKMLQMNSQELLEFVDRALEENPVLESESPESLWNDYRELQHAASWLDAGVSGPTFSASGAETDPTAQMADPSGCGGDSLSSFLCDQLERLKPSKPLLALSRYLANLVDEDGYLDPEDLEDLEELRLPGELIDQSLALLQSLEPPGVGARSLSECLVLQLRRKELPFPEVVEIARHFLKELGLRHYGPICRKLYLTQEQVETAEAIIAGLEPHPGRAFLPAAPAALYVRPDVFILEQDEELKVLLNEYYLPRISVSSYYERLLTESDEKETRAYLQKKIQQARWLLKSLEQRGSTLRRCAQEILELQRPFFAGETSSLAPMGITHLAQAVGVHPSTISRATRGKYLQCRQGTYPLRYFFNRELGEGVSSQAVKQRLLELIQGEDHLHPLSDEKLSVLLSGGKAEVARRTVAKYRMELRIGSSRERKARYRAADSSQ